MFMVICVENSVSMKYALMELLSIGFPYYMKISYLCPSIYEAKLRLLMKELLTRTIFGLLFAIVVVASVFVSPWACFALFAVVVIIGSYEMCRLHGMSKKLHLALTEMMALAAIAIGGFVALDVLPLRWLLLELPIFASPFLFALFSKRLNHETICSNSYASLLFLSMPSVLMLFMYRADIFGAMAGSWLVMLVFCLLWANDVFAYLTGNLLGRHKLFERISPGKTIEGSLGGMVFTIIATVVFSHYADWLSLKAGIGMAVIAVVFGTLGDLCESMLKRQAGVKDSGTLIPGHGGILDRFDSVLFSVPFIFVYLLLL